MYFVSYEGYPVMLEYADRNIHPDVTGIVMC